MKEKMATERANSKKKYIIKKKKNKKKGREIKVTFLCNLSKII